MADDPIVQAVFDRRLETASCAPIAVAVSGGGDSLYALIEAAAWARAHGRRVLALSVDHALQRDSHIWTRQAGEMAARLGCDFQALPWLEPKPVTGIPAAARQARHRLLADAAREAGARVIVLGHTGDDALENAALGQGELAQWGPSPVWPEGRGLALLRPMLASRRAVIRKRLTEEGWVWVDDPANTNISQPRIQARAAIAGQGALPAPTDRIIEAARRAVIGDEVIRLPRNALTPRLLAMAALSLGGGETPPRREPARKLAARLAEPVPKLTATLAGARILADPKSIMIAREAGEARRGGLLPGCAPGVWDGRYEIGGSGEILPLQGHARHLPPAQRQRLADLPAAARPGLPVIIKGDGVTCPVLADDPNHPVEWLWPVRFLTACGLYAHENDLRPWLR